MKMRDIMRIVEAESGDPEDAEADNPPAPGQKAKAKVSPKNTKARQVSKEQPLAIEAKKYKSAEEFVKAQPVLYHGSQHALETFEARGAFFTDDYNNADGYASGEYVYEGYLILKNPLVIDAKGRMWNDLDTPYGTSTQDVVGSVDSRKYDGVIFKNVKDSWIDDADYQDPGTIYFAFNAKKTFMNSSQLIDIYNKVHGKLTPP